jgi:N-acetylglucosaminyldiphosphoundecaprenol N-acetyl-beta-D-mannosaminyltransferase
VNTSIAKRETASVLGAPIDAISWEGALQRIGMWAQTRESRYVCICNAHSVVTASQDPKLAEALRAADMATPDGAPVAWMLRRLGYPSQQRINGPDLMLRYCDYGAARGQSIFLMGSRAETLSALQLRLAGQFPALRIAGSASPPFRPLTPDEDTELVEQINRSGASVVFVGLGCPKQEQWMHANRGRVRGVMIGVGAAFDFHAGTIQRAPTLMRDNGLEWLHRLFMEPRRLWKRYLVTNSAFALGAARQLLLGRSR